MESAYLCLLVCVIVVFVDFNQCDAATAGALGSNCTGAGNCSSVANATCDTTKTCQCIPSYKAVKQKCVIKVLNDSCTASTDCSNTNHLACDTNKCQCAPGYKPENGVCVPKVLGTPCGTDNATKVCTTPNSECPAAGQCSCKTNFVQEGGFCPTALGQHCTAASDCVSNAECDKTAPTCKCKAGFVKTSGLCAKPSSAVSLKIAMSTFGILIASNILLKAF